MVDVEVFARKVAMIRDAVARIRDTVPETPEAFVADRDARDIVALNLFVALQETIALATHWLADEGLMVPSTYGEVFTTLAERGVIELNAWTTDARSEASAAQAHAVSCV